ncbi:6-phosphogluconolactonase-like [Centruroides sculpturatus]|uniref:6-phosphogluconolactonase-like n=1 Tax=Centruroides sculpturatus TaxID=218467 RepID=UPI000C6E4F4B|nr:6-phosphogluconolactonase-like [Centruroides sculpturatus]
MGKQIFVLRDEQLIVNKLKDLIEEIAGEKLKKNDVFTIGLSGGSLIKYASQAFLSIVTEWTKWRFFFCDERLVPFDDKESTYGLYKEELLGKVPITEEQFVTINPVLNVEAAAQDYTKKMKEYFEANKFPSFDLLLLGIGPDGHTCSLFPGHPLLEENKLWVASIADSPKFPPCRITLTFPVINNAHNVIFIALGGSKAKIIKEIFREDSSNPLPAARISPSHGQLYWLMDNAAASEINKTE